MSKCVLCADSESLCRPELIGLDGESLMDASWLEVYSSAGESRAAIKSNARIDEVWVVSSDEMDAINLAAALKFDRADLRVFLVSSQMSGSSLSRAQAANLDGALSPRAFALRYAQEKKKRAGAGFACSPACLPVLADDVNEDDFLLAEGSQDAPAEVADLPDSSEGEIEVAPRANAQTLSLCVMGAGGGVGCSAFSLLASLILARRGMSVLLVDGDLRFGCLGGVVETEESKPVADVIDAADAGDDAALLLEGMARAGAVACLTAPERIELADRLIEELPGVVDIAAGLFDVVVVDAGGGFSGAHMALMERCTQSLIVVGQRTSSVRSCKRIVDLCSRCGMATSSLAVAVNRCSKGSLFSSIDVSCMLQGQRVGELREGGRIVEELVGIGTASALVADENAFSQSIEILLNSLLPEEMGKGDSAGRRPVLKSLGGSLFARKPPRSQKRGGSREHNVA